MLSNPEIERTLIGLALNYVTCAERFVQLPKDVFTVPEHVILYQIIKTLMAKGQTPDMVTVNNQLGGNDTAMAALMVQCTSQAISEVMYDQHEGTALDLRRRRRLSAACMAIAQKVGDPGEDTDAMAAELQAALNDNVGRSEAEPIYDTMLDYMDFLGQPADHISTGLAGFDNLNGGFRPGQLIYLGARPGVGKTALGLSIATHVARTSGPVLIASLEMTQTEIVERMVAAQSNVPLEALTRHKLSDEQWGNVWGQSNEIAKSPIWFMGAEQASTPARIKRAAAALARKSGLKLIMIDYIGLLKGGGQYKSRYEEMTDVSRQLKLMAMTLNVPVLSLTQFNRNSEHGSAKPTMSDARDTGALEQDANVFLVQYAPDEPKQGRMHDFWLGCKERGTEMQIINCEKYRQGKKGAFAVEFDQPHMRFRTLTSVRE